MTKQMERSFFPGRLYDSFKKVKASRLVSRHEVDDDSIKHFEHYLNASVPQSEREIGAREVVRAMFQELGYKHYFKIIRKNKTECTILYLDPRSIITYLNLVGHVYLSYADGVFNVMAIQRPPLSDVLAFKPISWIDDAEEYIKERDRRMEALKALKQDIEQLDQFITNGIADEQATRDDIERSVAMAIDKSAGEAVEVLIASAVASMEVDEPEQKSE